MVNTVADAVASAAGVRFRFSGEVPSRGRPIPPRRRTPAPNAFFNPRGAGGAGARALMLALLAEEIEVRVSAMAGLAYRTVTLGAVPEVRSSDRTAATKPTLAEGNGPSRADNAGYRRLGRPDFQTMKIVGPALARGLL
jgi:hypothetical protein